MKSYQASLQTPFGPIGLYFIKSRLAAIDFIDTAFDIKPRDHYVMEVCAQISTYLGNAKAVPSFNVSCYLQGTPFQQKVWKELTKIPSGTVVTYGALADKLDTSARAVGNACRKNPIPVVIPCHRVVSKHGLGGYAGESQGARVLTKSWLLRHEGALGS